jgi:hypothetical protein
MGGTHVIVGFASSLLKEIATWRSQWQLWRIPLHAVFGLRCPLAAYYGTALWAGKCMVLVLLCEEVLILFAVTKKLTEKPAEFGLGYQQCRSNSSGQCLFGTGLLNGYGNNVPEGTQLHVYCSSLVSCQPWRNIRRWPSGDCCGCDMSLICNEGPTGWVAF